MAYILERVGWDQWMDAGSCWRRNREAARVYKTREDADYAARQLNEEFAAMEGDEIGDDVIVIEV